MLSERPVGGRHGNTEPSRDHAGARGAVGVGALHRWHAEGAAHRGDKDRLRAPPLVGGRPVLAHRAKGHPAGLPRGAPARSDRPLIGKDRQNRRAGGAARLGSRRGGSRRLVPCERLVPARPRSSLKGSGRPVAGPVRAATRFKWEPAASPGLTDGRAKVFDLAQATSSYSRITPPRTTAFEPAHHRPDREAG